MSNFIEIDETGVPVLGMGFVSPTRVAASIKDILIQQFAYGNDNIANPQIKLSWRTGNTPAIERLKSIHIDTAFPDNAWTANRAPFITVIAGDSNNAPVGQEMQCAMNGHISRGIGFRRQFNMPIAVAIGVTKEAVACAKLAEAVYYYLIAYESVIKEDLQITGFIVNSILQPKKQAVDDLYIATIGALATNIQSWQLDSNGPVLASIRTSVNGERVM